MWLIEFDYNLSIALFVINTDRCYKFGSAIVNSNNEVAISSRISCWILTISNLSRFRFPAIHFDKIVICDSQCRKRNIDFLPHSHLSAKWNSRIGQINGNLLVFVISGKSVWKSILCNSCIVKTRDKNPINANYLNVWGTKWSNHEAASLSWLLFHSHSFEFRSLVFGSK